MAQIQTIDVPGLLAMYTGVRQQTLENQYRAEQIELARKQREEADVKRQLIGKVFSGQPSAPKPSPAPTPTPAPTASDLDQFMPGTGAGMLANGQPVGSAPASPPVSAPTALLDPSQLPPRTDGMSINQDAMRELYQLSPETAIEIQKMVFDMDEATAKRIQARGTAMAQAAGVLLKAPDRRAALQQLAPQLYAVGFTPEELAQTDLSDAGLNNYFRAGMSMEQIIGQQKAERDAMRDERDFGLRRDQFEETKRANRARESVAAGNLNLSRQREGRIRQWGPQAVIIGTSGPRNDTSDLDY